ncbi:MAG: 2-C-methyl-D-erythritol 4-phosphate cytidylyltransferase [Lachnospiraceae bacterium]|nr:2-C-methyl-D-erythritol 4-phosphate cytidylyltransferase [Lachnospiraceae bacterium]
MGADKTDKRHCVHALLLSGGKGSRLNAAVPKQYIKTSGRMMISRTIDALAESGAVTDVWIVAEGAWRASIENEFSDRAFLKGFSDPGDTRQLSVLNGLRDMKDLCGNEDIVLIQDAARPFTSAALIEKCIEACVLHDGAMPVLPMKDTVYMSDNGAVVSKLLEREKIFAGQAPEAFIYAKYLKACEALLPDKIYGIKGSSEPAVLAGMDIAMIPGDEANFKVTTAADLKRYEELVNGI